jgi:hypothetical protein
MPVCYAKALLIVSSSSFERYQYATADVIGVQTPANMPLVPAQAIAPML